MADEETTVQRKVYFFKIEHFSHLKDSIPSALSRINELPFNDEGRYRPDTKSNSRLCVFVDEAQYPIKIRFGKTRRDLLPQIEENGNLQTLELQENAGLIDISHIMVFEDGFVAAEWNFEGPKIAQLGPYLFEKGRINTQPSFLVLMERDIVQVVSNLKSVRVLEIDVSPDAAAIARDVDDQLVSAIEASSQLGGTKRVCLKLTSDNNSSHILAAVAKKLANIVKNRPHERSNFHGISVSGYDGEIRANRFVDILESKLVSGEIFTRTSSRSRSINSDDAYRVINRAYLSNREKLLSAATSTDWT